MKSIVPALAASALFAFSALAQDSGQAPGAPDEDRDAAIAAPGEVVVPAGTMVPLVMVNSVSSKHSQPGDPVYLQSVAPVVVGQRILIPAGTHVSGQVLVSKRPGRVKGRGQLNVRLDQLILPNGVIRSLLGRPGALDGRSRGDFDRETGTVKSEGTKGEDASDIATTTATGASIGVLAGSAAGRVGAGLGIGAAAGAAAGITSVLLTRGPDASLERGTHVEMVLEQDLRFAEDEMQFRNPAGSPSGQIGAGPDRGSRQRPLRSAPRVGRLPL